MTAAMQHVGFDPVADEADWNITKVRSIRLEQGLWNELGPAALANGLDRSGLIRQFVRWYLRVPGAQLPQRPSRPGHPGDD